MSEPDETGVVSGVVESSGWWEAFQSNVEIYTVDQYKRQWTKAIRESLDNRTTSCLIVDLVAGDFSIGAMSCYSLIPSEEARGSKYYGQQPEGFFLTESMFTVTFDPNELRKSNCLQLSDGSTSGPVAIYYFDPERPELFFPYLENSIADLWNRFLTNAELSEFIERNG